MIISHTISDLRKAIEQSGQQQIGFVPTMGALHAGHISLVKRCVAENELCVVSVFVNPTQFNDKNDLKNYPRTPEADAKLLEEAGCNIVFMPSVEEMYPETDTRQFHFGSLETVMEGQYRPGHFNGVAQIVSKLFDAVKPTRAYFGEKDFQQVAIIKNMVSQLHLPLEIVACPIVREESGLAKSSRNTLLSDSQREGAARIYRILKESLSKAALLSVADTKAWVLAELEKDPEYKADYYAIVDGNSLQDINDWNESTYIVGCVAVYCGKIRLIDNIAYKKL